MAEGVAGARGTRKTYHGDDVSMETKTMETTKARRRRAATARAEAWRWERQQQGAPRKVEVR